MKKIIYGLSVLSFIAFGNTSCNKKYEDGPSISLRSEAVRVQNTWKVEAYYENDIDKTNDFLSTYKDYTENYTKDGDYSYTYTDSKGALQAGSGKWQFQNDEKEIKRSGVSGQSSVDMTILKLRQKSFWYTYTDNGVKIEMHLTEK